MNANKPITPRKLQVLNDEESRYSPVSTERGIRKNTTDKAKHSISPLSSAQFSPIPFDIPVLGEGGGLLDGFYDEAQTSPGSRPESRSGSRPGSSASKSVPPSPHSGSSLRRQPTPTKQISLQAVKRKEEKEGPIPLEPDLTWNSFIRTPRSFPNTSRTSPEANKVSKPEIHTDKEGNIIGAHAMDSEFSSLIAASADGLKDNSGPIQPERPELKKSGSLYKSEDPENDEESSSSTEEGDVAEEEDLIGHKGKAPNNLLMEFLTAVMEKDYQTAAKLCKMILIYEPDNKEALSFAPLIEEKIKLDEEADVNESEGVDEEGEEEEEEEDDEKEEDDGDDSEEDSDADEEDEEGSDHDSESENDSDGPLDSGFSDGF
ncbi:hypothetical protein CHS0354_032106 [Potamilus streckersoni]|uniref:Glutamate-rich protein 2 n=1 Tax=Potamilus streckersoni TaxID=2493646 RepID=A0AAE0RLW9_9BIVA|nr:hypothetical protein CHS0354_032106 [Potamilus streckersoni]